MKLQRIYLLTESDGFFGQHLQPWESIDTKIFIDVLSKEFEIVPITYMQISTGEIRPENSVIVHSSSQQQEYKHFVDDQLLYLFALGNQLVPSIHVTRSHENKGYQELHKRLANVDSLPAVYFAKRKELDISGWKYPMVVKRINGFGSTGVALSNSSDELEHAVQPEIRTTARERLLVWRRRLGRFFRFLTRRKLPALDFGNYYEPLERFVIQKYVAGLDGDFKVIAFQNAIFVLKRDVRPGDFRASGSGIFQFVDPPAGLLDYACGLLKKFNEPYMSFDIAASGDGFHLIEFQGVHFGPWTVVNARFYFAKTESGWEKTAKGKSFEGYMADSIVLHIRNNQSPES